MIGAVASDRAVPDSRTGPLPAIAPPAEQLCTGGSRHLCVRTIPTPHHRRDISASSCHMRAGTLCRSRSCVCGEQRVGKPSIVRARTARIETYVHTQAQQTISSVFPKEHSGPPEPVKFRSAKSDVSRNCLYSQSSDTAPLFRPQETPPRCRKVHHVTYGSQDAAVGCAWSAANWTVGRRAAETRLLGVHLMCVMLRRLFRGCPSLLSDSADVG